jgi:hypothetical protein
MEAASATHAPSSPVPLPACISSSFGMSSRLPKSVCSSCLIKPAVEFPIDVADMRFPNEMRHTWLAAMACRSPARWNIRTSSGRRSGASAIDPRHNRVLCRSSVPRTPIAP